MKMQYSRRELLKSVVAVSATALLPRATSAADREIEIQITSISENTLRLTLLPIRTGTASVPSDGSLVQTDWGPPLATLRGSLADRLVKCGRFTVQVNTKPVSLIIADNGGAILQRLTFDPQSGSLSFITADGHLLGLGEGGPQFDRRGSIDEMRSGQGAYKLETHGGRVPIPWIIGTDGWAIFIHHPFGRLDFTTAESKFQPRDSDHVLPLDIFFIGAQKPETIMAEYARLTGYPEMPPLWALGYQQSHRTLASREEVLQETKTFRSKKLPCDALIYLGTGFCPSGWNTENGSFAWNSKVFPTHSRSLPNSTRTISTLYCTA